MGYGPRDPVRTPRGRTDNAVKAPRTDARTIGHPHAADPLTGRRTRRTGTGPRLMGNERCMLW
ncbi:hypothetical protein Kpho02_24090 [Kitasatospora phosalacinea]|uniref:Uncharacterized protein n=1 Tax=Kitasatospora phosalacinea TaxID=2065 RepID=A0A9W6Q4P8_9ACTN|nr:hypothetical protein Kpho02_24090 [Kitasatospora phosalacinea]